jgi:hypothetical protein
MGAYILVVSACLWVIIDSAPEEEAVAVVSMARVTVPDILATETEVIVPIAEPVSDTYIPAHRLGNEMQLTDTLPPPPPIGLQGKPFAPEELTGCAEMEFYRVQWELPEYFGGERWQIGFKESSCRNDVSSFCCHGYWQLYVSLHLRDHRLAPRYAECEIDSVDDLLGTSPLQKQKNGCAAKAALDVSGCGAWDTCPF